MSQVIHCDPAAEKDLIGACLVSDGAIAEAVAAVRPRDFYAAHNDLIWRAMTDLFNRGQKTDLSIVAAELETRGELSTVGGAEYLAQAVAGVATASNVTWYIAIVLDRAKRRAIRDAASALSQLCQAQTGESADELLDKAQAAVWALTDRTRTREGDRLSALMGEYASEESLSAPRPARAPTGLTCLDEIVGGWEPGQLILVAARPSVGKSALALQFARAAAVKQNQAAILFTLEMSREETTYRLIAAEAGVPLSRLKRHTLEPPHFRWLAQARATLDSAPLWIDDSPQPSLTEIRAKCRRQMRRGGLNLAVIDYLQLMSSPSARGRETNRQQEVSEISRGLKLLAKELGVPIIALSQLNRAAEARSDRRPQLSDLRESGALEQDADIVMLLHRKDADAQGAARSGQGYDKPQEIDLIVAKHRNGPTGTAPLLFYGSKADFKPRVDMDGRPEGASVPF